MKLPDLRKEEPTPKKTTLKKIKATTPIPTISDSVPSTSLKGVEKEPESKSKG